MSKNGVIIPICFSLVSGCSVFDSSEMTTEAPPVTVASEVVTEREPWQAAAEVRLATSNEAKIVPSRSISLDDIRRLQLRLQELGFNPGPVDGVAGVKTKTAFGRLETACAKLEPLSENLPAGVVQASSGTVTADKVLSRADTTILQSQLRTAGFDPGPVDGILGPRTKSLVAMLHSSCAMAKEFQGTLDQPVLTANLEKRPAPEALKRSPGSLAAHNESIKQTAIAQPGSQDEIRILQLRLRDAGFDPGPFDGIMGAKTKAALGQYEASQRNRKIKTSLTTTKISGQY